MAPQVAVAFAFAALALMQLSRPLPSRFSWLPALAAAVVFLIALISLFGRLLRLDIVYDWHYATRIAPHTAAGLLLLALGLAQLTYQRSFNKADDVSNDSRRILAVSTAAMLAITIACAAMCFAVVVRHSHDLQQQALGRELRNQVELISTEIAADRHEGERLVSSQSLAQIMARRALRAEGEGPPPALLQALRAWSDHRLPLSKGLLAAQMKNAAGQPLLQSGVIAPARATIVALDSTSRIEIGAEAHLVIERPLPPDASGRSGVMTLRFALSRLTAALQTNSSGQGFDTSICHALSLHTMQCLRLSGSPLPGLPLARDSAGRTGALNLAFTGRTGVTLGAEPDGARC
jgi:hypothetical protein